MFDFNAIKKTITDAMPALRKHPECLGPEQCPGLSDWLPYVSFDEETGMFLNTHSRGYVIEAMPLTGLTESQQENLTAWLTNRLPDAATFQVCLWLSPKVGDALGAFGESRRAYHDKTARLSDAREALFKKGAWKPLGGTGRNPFRHTRLFFVLAADHKYAPEILSLGEDFIGLLASLGSQGEMIKPQGFIDWLFQMLNPSDSIQTEPYFHYSPLEKLSRQITSGNLMMHVEPDHLLLERDNAQWQVATWIVDSYPKQWQAALAPQLVGKAFNANMQLPCPVLYTFTLRKTGASKTSTKLNAGTLMSDYGDKNTLMRLMPHLRAFTAEKQWLLGLVEQGERLAETTFHITAFCRPKDAAKNHTALENLWTSQQFKLQKKRYLALPQLLMSLPFGLPNGLMSEAEAFRMARWLRMVNCTDIMPLYSEPRGDSDPMVMFSGRKGQTFGFNPFSGTENNNMAVTGSSGNGKSVFIQDLIVGILSRQGRVWVIDQGKSYQNLCALLGGTFLEFKTSKPMSLNPFTHLEALGNDEMNFIKPLLCAMARPNHPCSDEEANTIENALRHVWKQNKQKTTITHIAAYLASAKDGLSRNLSLLLYPYTQQGMYGVWFEGPCEMAFDNPFVVIELEDLSIEQNKHFRNLVFMMMFHHISQGVYRSDTQTYKAVIIDEAWDLLGHGAASAKEVIERGYRASRRKKASFISITQQVSDYSQSAVAQTAKANSHWQWVFGSSNADDNAARLGLSAFGSRLLSSLTKSAHYSECVLHTEAATIALRLPLDKLSYLTYTTHANDKATLDKLQSQGMSLWEAIQYCAEVSS